MYEKVSASVAIGYILLFDSFSDHLCKKISFHTEGLVNMQCQNDLDLIQVNSMSLHLDILYDNFNIFWTLSKFMFSKKVRKFEKIFTVDLTLCSKCQIHGENFVNFYGLLRKHELYQAELIIFSSHFHSYSTKIMSFVVYPWKMAQVKGTRILG